MDVKRYIYIGLGCLAVGLAFAGAILPGVPVTVFVLCASYCFARSSPRFDAWLHNNRLLGPPLRRFKETGGMSKTAKSAALTSMWIAITLSSIALLRVNIYAPMAVVLLGVIGTLTIIFGVRTVPAAQ
jgi:uncharacterized protein